MLSVDNSLQGQGIGKRLLRDVFSKVYQISKLSGCTGIYLLAEKDDEPLPMFLNIDTVLELFSAVRINT